MKHTLFASLIVFAGVLSGCQTRPVEPPVAASNQVSERPAAAPVTGGFDWTYDISGDQPVRPIQVFSNAEKTWIQMAPHQVMPALFVDGKPVPFDLQPPYLIVQGQPQRIDVIATAYRAVIAKRNSQPVVPQAAQQREGGTNRIQSIPTSQVQKIQE